jgi:hypothetical protein
MKKKLATIAERRQRLVAQVEEQRGTLVKNIKPLHGSLNLADKSLTIMSYVKKHPVLVMSITALVGMLRPTRTVKWLRRSWIASLMMWGLRIWLTKN